MIALLYCVAGAGAGAPLNAYVGSNGCASQGDPGYDPRCDHAVADSIRRYSAADTGELQFLDSTPVGGAPLALASRATPMSTHGKPRSHGSSWACASAGAGGQGKRTAAPSEDVGKG